MIWTDVGHRVEYGLVRTVRAFVGAMPELVARGLGSCIGAAFYVSDGKHRRLAIKQLRAAFPSKTADECRAIARATFVHFGRLLVALLRFSALTPAQMRERVEFEGEDRVRVALAQHRGVLFITGHFGFWELQALAHALAMPTISVVARPLDNPYLHQLLEDTRCATGNRVIYRQGALRRILRALAANEGVAILIDQHIQPADAVVVDFFNRPVSTTAAVATLALRTGAPIIPVFALPLARGRYRFIYEHPIETPAANAADPVRELTQRCTDVLEMYVRRHPHLWLWMHRRWRDQDAEPASIPGMFPSAAPDKVEEPADS